MRTFRSDRSADRGADAAGYGAAPVSGQAIAQVLADAGAGLLVWLSVGAALLAGRGGLPALAALQAEGVGLALLMSALAVPSLRRAPTRGRRVAAAAWLAALGGGIALLVVLRRSGPSQAWTIAAGAVACLGALAAVAALAWPGRDEAAGSGRRPAPMQVPLRLCLALFGGLALLFALAGLRGPGPLPADAALPSLLLLGTMALALLVGAWRAEGDVREPAIRRLRGPTLLLLTAVPWGLALAAGSLAAMARSAWPLAALSVLAGMLGAAASGAGYDRRP